MKPAWRRERGGSVRVLHASRALEWPAPYRNGDLIQARATNLAVSSHRKDLIAYVIQGKNASAQFA